MGLFDSARVPLRVCDQLAVIGAKLRLEYNAKIRN